MEKRKSNKNANNADVVRKWKILPKWIPDKNLVGSKNLKKDQCIHLDTTLSDKFVVANLSCFFDKSMLKQSFHTLNNEQEEASECIQQRS